MSPQKIKQIRTKLGLTQTQLAESLCVARLTLSQYETGFRNPNKTVIVILMVLDKLPLKDSRELLDLLNSCSKKINRTLHE